MANAGKVLLKTAVHCLRDYCKEGDILPEEQSSFRPQRLARHVVHRSQKELARAGNKSLPAHVCFVDLQQAYDSADRDLLWNVLARYGLPPDMTSGIRQLHDDT